LFVNSIGGEESYASNDNVKLSRHTDLARLQFDPGGYLPGRFVFDPGGYLQFNPHGFIKSTSVFPGSSLMFGLSQLVLSTYALSSGETNGNQHPLFSIALLCILPHLMMELSRQPSDQFIKAPHRIYHVVFYPVHSGKVFGNSLVTASRSATMASQVKEEMDTMLSGLFGM